MWKIFCISMLWIMGSTIGAQEYLPPKAGGKKAAEPTMPANYNFSYDVQDNDVTLDFGHNEKRKDDKVTGSYHVLLPDGRMQLVEYEAGPDGYKPKVMYMGTAMFPDEKSDKFDGYHYNAASNRQSVRRPAPRGGDHISRGSASDSEHTRGSASASEHTVRISASGTEHTGRISASGVEHTARISASGTEHTSRISASGTEHLARGTARQATAAPTSLQTSDAPTHAPTLHIPPTNSSH